jgi:nicotinamidase/pyrazinamidase
LGKIIPMKLIFWNVDTQIDFVEPSGKLYFEGAETIKPTLEKLTKLAYEKSIVVVNTADLHHSSSAELSVNPDFKTTFPPHCMAGTEGADFISETFPETPSIIDWDEYYDTASLEFGVKNSRNIVIRKDAFDVFLGNRYTEQILQIIAPETVVVYGVTTNVCVNDAVVGLAARGKKVIVISDAIKELPNLPLPFENWNQLGIEMMTIGELEKILNQI